MECKKHNIRTNKSIKPIGIAYTTIDGSIGVMDFNNIGFASNKIAFAGLYYGPNHKVVPLEFIHTEKQLIKYLKENNYITS